MPKVEVDLQTTVSPERVRAALIDFTPRRPEIWPGITPRQYKVYEVAESSAEIREGTQGLWAAVFMSNGTARPPHSWVASPPSGSA